MYTEGIRKIFACKIAKHLDVVLGQARDAGYKAALFNGCVFCYNSGSGKWIKSPFTIEDFMSS